MANSFMDALGTVTGAVKEVVNTGAGVVNTVARTKKEINEIKGSSQAAATQTTAVSQEVAKQNNLKRYFVLGGAGLLGLLLVGLLIKKIK